MSKTHENAGRLALMQGNQAYAEGNFPVAEELCSIVLSLPIHTEMTEEMMSFIIATIKEFYK